MRKNQFTGISLCRSTFRDELSHEGAIFDPDEFNLRPVQGVLGYGRFLRTSWQAIGDL